MGGGNIPLDAVGGYGNSSEGSAISGKIQGKTFQAKETVSVKALTEDISGTEVFVPGAL